MSEANDQTKMTKTQVLQIKGSVVEKTTGEGLAGLHVHVMDKDIIGKDDVLGTTKTDAAGNFQIETGRDRFDERLLDISFDQNPDIYFRIFDSIGNLLAQTDPVTCRFTDQFISARIEVFSSGHKGYEPLYISSFSELANVELIILRRINQMTNGGLLFMTHPFQLLTDVGVFLSGNVREEIVQRIPELSVLSLAPYQQLKKSKSRQPVQYTLHGLFPQNK